MRLVVDPLSGARAVVDVARGGTIRSWQGADGDELFAQGAPPARALAPGDPFVRSGLTGHVECLPTIDACEVPGQPSDPLVDHGALWNVPWAVGDEGPGRLRLSTRLLGWPLVMTRDVEVSSTGLRLGYRLDNDGPDPVPVLWAGHGLLAAPAGTRVLATGVPPGGWRVTATSPGLAPATAASLLARTAGDHGGLALDALPLGGWVKAYAHWPPDGAWLVRGATRVHVQGEGPVDGLRLGLWLNNHGIPAGAPLRHVALEPTTGDSDDLAECVRRDTCWWVPPASTAHWSMSYTVHRSG